MDLKNYIRDIPDFPKKGIVFKDISPLLADPDAFSFALEMIGKNIQDVDKILALDARGFLFGGGLAHKYKIPLVMARKPGKLPGETVSISYDLEYGSNTLEIQKDAIQPGEKICIIDDLLATGGTAKAACSLVEKMGGIVESVRCIVELEFLSGRKNLEGYNIQTLITY